jgi:hypothetical protein
VVRRVDVLTRLRGDGGDSRRPFSTGRLRSRILIAYLAVAVSVVIAFAIEYSYRYPYSDLDALCFAATAPVVASHESRKTPSQVFAALGIDEGRLSEHWVGGFGHHHWEAWRLSRRYKIVLHGSSNLLRDIGMFYRAEVVRDEEDAL